MSAVLFQSMPPLSPDEYAALEQSIRDHGIQVPAVVDENGVVIDGHHRQKIAQHLGIECPTRVVMGRTDAQKRTLSLSLNIDRRHLTRDQRRALVAESLKSDPQLSDREHSRRTGVSDKTVGVIREGMVESAEIPHFERRVDPRTGQASQPVPPRPEPPEPRPVDATELTERKPARKPITEAFWRRSYDLARHVESIERLIDDDRFNANRQVLADKNLRHLKQTANTLTRVLAALEK